MKKIIIVLIILISICIGVVLLIPSDKKDTSKPNTKITETHTKISTKLDQIPEEKNENDIKASEEEKKDELNNGEERINEEIKIEQNQEEEENKDNLKNKNFYPERNIDSVINENSITCFIKSLLSDL